MSERRADRRGTPRGRDGHVARVAAAALVAVLVLGVCAGVAVAVSASFSAAPPTSGNGGGREVVSDKAQPEEPEAPAADDNSGDQQLPSDDERAADLALDPNRQTDWLDHSNGEKILYLTFDDGPSANTEKVLDILDKYGAKATFFVTGHEPEYRPMIAEAYRRGNTIGMHSYTHDYATIYQSEDAFFGDLSQVADVVKEQIGYVPYLTRFPGGVSNTVSESYCPGIMTALASDLQAKGYQYYDWNVSSSDASGNHVPVDTIVQSSCAYGSFTNVSCSATTPPQRPPLWRPCRRSSSTTSPRASSARPSTARPSWYTITLITSEPKTCGMPLSRSVNPNRYLNWVCGRGAKRKAAGETRSLPAALL